jgi:MFS family permease
VVLELAGEARYYAASSMLSSIQQAGVVVAPIVAGVLIGTIGAGVALLVDAASFGACAYCVATLTRPASFVVREGIASPPTLRAVALFRKYRGVTAVFALTLVFYLCYGPMVVALPVLAHEVAGSFGPQTLGVLWAGFGIGAVAGSLLGGMRPAFVSSSVAAVIVGCWGITTLTIGLSHSLVVALVAMVFGGFTYAPFLAITSALLQQAVPNGVLAQVTSYWSVLTGAASPLGIVTAGALVPTLGARRTLVSAGVSLIVVALFSFVATQAKGRAGMSAASGGR